MSKREDTAPPENGRSSSKPTNEYVLNVAFYSFVGFMSVQAVFALIANSEAMLADSEAMSVDAFTYLFNLWAERIKREPLSGHNSSVLLQNYRQELRRLYLELIPPAISVATLVMVTVFTLRDALKTMQGQESGEEDQDVDISIMLFFSGLNLLLDVVNVTCFARADSAFGLDVIRRNGESIRRSLRPSSNSNQSISMEMNADERSNLLPMAGGEVELETATTTTSFASSTSDQPNDLVNLNMCSAWTVSQSIVHCIKNNGTRISPECLRLTTSFSFTLCSMFARIQCAVWPFLWPPVLPLLFHPLPRLWQMPWQHLPCLLPFSSVSSHCYTVSCGRL
jgi:Co/Zn/Cd efflux system component